MGGPLSLRHQGGAETCPAGAGGYSGSGMQFVRATAILCAACAALPVAGSDVVFAEETAASGLAGNHQPSTGLLVTGNIIASMISGGVAGDFNNDGFQDLFLTNGFVSADKEENYWYDYSQIAGGNKIIIADAANWPKMGNLSLGGHQTKRVWVNNGAGQFQDVAQAVGVAETFDGRAVALADLWNRGVLDVIVAHQKGPLLIYRNEVPAEGRNWIAFELEAAKGNRSAIGAQVRLEHAAGVTLQELQSASGFCAQNQRRLHFGLGAAASVTRAVIRWPGGQEQVLEAPAINQVHRLQEPAAAAQGSR